MSDQVTRDQSAADRALVAHGRQQKAAALDRARARASLVRRTAARVETALAKGKYEMAATLLEDMRIGTLLAIQDVEEGR